MCNVDLEIGMKTKTETTLNSIAQTKQKFT